MVRLKDKEMKKEYDDLIFQFQYGAIKSLKNASNSHQVPVFQFQYGAIKRYTRKYTITISANFNSSMVRLKESTFQCRKA